MEAMILLVLGIPAALAIWLIIRALRARDELAELGRRVDSLEFQIAQLRTKPESARTVTPAREPQKIPVPFPALKPQPAAIFPPVIQPQVAPVINAPSPSLPPPPPPFVAAKPAVNWEHLMGVKGLAWIGGFTFFLGVIFAIQYSFAHHLLSQSLQACLGFLTGLGVLVAGVVLSRKKFPTLSQTLCATGILLLYAESFAGHSYYRFSFFGTIPTFLLMALVTTTAFLLAVRFNALVVAVLGMLGGFLTPILLSTGQDNPGALFGYIAILDAGLILITLRRRWFFLVALAALGTGIMQVGWAARFFVAERYFEGNKVLVALAVLLGFDALYLTGAWLAKTTKFRQGETSALTVAPDIEIKKWFFGSTIGLAAVALLFAFWFLHFPSLAHRPWLMFGFVILIDLVIPTLGLAEEMTSAAYSVFGLVIFGLLGFWTQRWLDNDLLAAALAFYFIFAILHSALPHYLRRRGARPTRAIHLFPLLALILVLVPIFQLSEVSIAIWPFILLLDLLSIALAVLTGSLLSVLAVLLLTLAATGALILRIPLSLAGLSSSFVILGGFALFFTAASIWLARRFEPGQQTQENHSDGLLAAPEEIAALLPSCSVALPFLLLIMATLRLPMANPSPVFGLALLLVVLLLGVTKYRVA